MPCRNRRDSEHGHRRRLGQPGAADIRDRIEETRHHGGMGAMESVRQLRHRAIFEEQRLRQLAEIALQRAGELHRGDGVDAVTLEPIVAGDLAGG